MIQVYVITFVIRSLEVATPSKNNEKVEQTEKQKLF